MSINGVVEDRYIIREFKPEGSPVMLMGYITDGLTVDPATARMYPIIGEFIGAALPDEIMQSIAGGVATRLTSLYKMSLVEGKDKWGNGHF